MRTVVCLAFPDFQLLDLAGPIAAFEVAEGFRPGSYRLRVRCHAAGRVESSSGVALEAEGLGSARNVHTLLVAGGDGTRQAAECQATLRLVRACAAAGARIASVCSGTYLLAAAGLLDGKRATTHWCRTRHFADTFPRVRLEPDKIFVRDGNVWSSAGITAGIDLALALITQDLGEALARRVARQLVVYYRRPGGQSQFSALLDLESASDRFQALLDYARTHLTEPLTVPQLAARTGMSPRNFARCFATQLGVTPAKAVERLRVEAARALLESGADSVGDVARQCGFGDAERMRRALLRCCGTLPSSLRRRYESPGH